MENAIQVEKEIYKDIALIAKEVVKAAEALQVDCDRISRTEEYAKLVVLDAIESIKEKIYRKSYGSIVWRMRKDMRKT